MSGTSLLSSKSWLAIILVAALLVLFGVYSGQVMIPVAAFCTAGIAAFDSSHVHLWRYKTGLSYGPIGLFVIGALIWPVVLVWYFIVRIRIARGTMPLRAEFKLKQNLA